MAIIGTKAIITRKMNGICSTSLSTSATKHAAISILIVLSVRRGNLLDLPLSQSLVNSSLFVPCMKLTNGAINMHKITAVKTLAVFTDSNISCITGSKYLVPPQ